MTDRSTNQEIADELHVSIPAVKTHLRTLFEKLAIAGRRLPYLRPRMRLARSRIRGYGGRCDRHG